MPVLAPIGQSLETVGECFAAGAATVFGYNRQNYMYDRKMRQEQEFQIMDYRNRQVELWREDVKDLIGMTEKKMDNYLIVNALQLGFCVGMFTEGRLEPGTPDWLLRLYMLSLSGAFMYLLMSVWLAMHASVVAQASEVRLLTQMVRLPIPSWAQIEATRTYCKSFEGMGMNYMLRVPFMKTIFEGQKQGAEATNDSVDPWGLERHGADINELQHGPVVSARHVQMVRRAALQWQSFDAFARVSMNAGTTQLCFALTYYCLGYVLVQDGAAWAAWSAAAIFTSIALMLIQLDLSLTTLEHKMALVLISAGPVISSCAALTWATYTLWGQTFAMLSLPLAFSAHSLWLLYFIRLIGIQEHPGGAWLPTKFRSVLYLDVFGWWVGAGEKADVQTSASRKNDKSRKQTSDYMAMRQTAQSEFKGPNEDASDSEPEVAGTEGESEALCESEESSTSESGRLFEQKAKIKAMMSQWQSPQVQNVMDAGEQVRVNKITKRFHDAEYLCGGEPAGEPSAPGTPRSNHSLQRSQWLKMKGFSDVGTEYQYYFHPASGEIRYDVSSAQGTEPGEEPSALAASLSFMEERVDSFREKVAEHMSDFVDEALTDDTLAALHSDTQKDNIESSIVSEPGEAHLQEEKNSDTVSREETQSTEYGTVGTSLNTDRTTFTQGTYLNTDRSFSNTQRGEVGACKRSIDEGFALDSQAPRLPTLPSETSQGTSSGTSLPRRNTSPLRSPISAPAALSPTTLSPSTRRATTDFSGSQNPKQESKTQAEKKFASEKSPYHHHLHHHVHVAAALSQTHHNCFESKKKRSMRPEDVHMYFDSYAQKGVHEASKKLRDEAHGKHAGVKGPLQGIGPLGAAPDLTDDAFDPASYYLQGKANVPKMRRLASAIDDQAIGQVDLEANVNDKDSNLLVTGHDTMKAGMTPWFIFRRATILLVWLWALAGMWSLQRVCGFAELEIRPLPAVEEALFGDKSPERVHGHERKTAIEGPPIPGGLTVGAELAMGNGEYYQSMNQGFRAKTDLKDILNGDTILAEWPHRHFQPRGMSCDPTGNHFVVADDFGVYAAELWPHKESNSGGELTPIPMRAKFKAVPPCDALEGQALKDVGVVCQFENHTSDGHTQKGATCHALVLHRNGQRLAECPLRENQGDSQVTFKISGQWLRQAQEQIEAVAIDNECFGTGGVDDLKQNGCVVVGTTHGRVVQLRRHLRHQNELVPSFVLQEEQTVAEHEAITSGLKHGSLHVLPGGYLMSMQSDRDSVQALDAKEGIEVGEWRLPANHTWSALCGGGSYLYALGRPLGSHNHELWRFPAPARLQLLKDVLAESKATEI